MDRTGIAIVGTGYVAEMYGVTPSRHPELVLVGAYDKSEARLSAFCRRWPVRSYTNLEELLADPSVEIVLNLTDPRSHFEVSSRCLDSGKHVYSEKPLGVNTKKPQARVTGRAARTLSGVGTLQSSQRDGPQTVWKAITEGVVGTIRLVYANFDDGMIAPTWPVDLGQRLRGAVAGEGRVRSRVYPYPRRLCAYLAGRVLRAGQDCQLFLVVPYSK